MFAHFALPYDLPGFSSPFFRSCSALAFRLLSKACSWFCGLAKVTATFLVWIWDPRTVNELDIVRGLASFFGFTYGASFERLKNTMVIFSPKCWVALPEAFFQQTWDTCAKKEVCQKKSVLPSKLSPLLFFASPRVLLQSFDSLLSLHHSQSKNSRNRSPLTFWSIDPTSCAHPLLVEHALERLSWGRRKLGKLKSIQKKTATFLGWRQHGENKTSI